MTHTKTGTNSRYSQDHVLALLENHDISQYITEQNICLACERVFGVCFSFNIWSARLQPERFYQQMRELARTKGTDESCFPIEEVRRRHGAQRFLRELYRIAVMEQRRVTGTLASNDGGNFVIDVSL